MSQEYAFRNMTLGVVESTCNEMAELGFGPDEMYKEGNRMYILFSKWVSLDEEDVELSELDQVYVALDGLSERVSDVEATQSLLVRKTEVEAPIAGVGSALSEE